ncbi:hypothetical protein J6590_047848 [Homalodisca vitripennis]|nr:hypothetical protein J6590_047848 [Homalodisca vitripennis]
MPVQGTVSRGFRLFRVPKAPHFPTAGTSNLLTIGSVLKRREVQLLLPTCQCNGMKVRQFALRRPPTSSQGLACREEVTRLLTVEPLPLRVQPQSLGNLRRGWAPPPCSTLFAEAIKVGHKVNLPGEGRVQRLPIHRIAPCIDQRGLAGSHLRQVSGVP